MTSVIFISPPTNAFKYLKDQDTLVGTQIFQFLDSVLAVEGPRNFFYIY